MDQDVTLQVQEQLDERLVLPLLEGLDHRLGVEVRRLGVDPGAVRVEPVLQPHDRLVGDLRLAAAEQPGAVGRDLRLAAPGVQPAQAERRQDRLVLVGHDRQVDRLDRRQEAERLLLQLQVAALDVAQLVADDELQLLGAARVQVQQARRQDQVVLVERPDDVGLRQRRVADVDGGLGDPQGPGALLDHPVERPEGGLALDRERLGDDVGDLLGVDELVDPAAELLAEAAQDRASRRPRPSSEGASRWANRRSSRVAMS